MPVATGTAAHADSCFETADTGWVCTPDPNPSLTVTMSSDPTFVDVLEAPDDATLVDATPDPNAPEAAPDAWVETDTSVPQATALNCKSWNTATWLAPSDNTCPPVHWKGGSFHVRDHTGGAWPVSAETSYWDTVPGLSAGYGCSTTYHCVNVYEGHYGATKWLGLTTYTYNQLHQFTSVTVKFNDSYRVTAAQRQQAVCHELGHVSGLGHETQNNSCMWHIADGTHTSGNSNDFNQLSNHTY